jgi:perosamine synthetase
VGDKVLTTAFSFIASTTAIVHAGATPIFADIDEDSFCMTPDSVRKALNEHPDIRAILLVHLFGQACDMEAICEIARECGLFVVEDCAQCHGATFKGKMTGSFGDVACYSFYPTKNMTTSEGGIVLFQNPDLAERCRILCNHGMKVRYYHDMVGYNYRMTNIAAAIGIVQLKKLPNFTTRVHTRSF